MKCISSHLSRGFVAGFLLVVLAVPVAQPWANPEDGPWKAFLSGLGDVFRPPSLANRRLQIRMDDLERGLEESSWARRVSLGPLQWLLAGWGGHGNEKVYVGYHGWLFYRPGIDYVTGPPFLDPAVLERRRRSGESWQSPPESDPRTAVLDFHRQLRERGIRLLLVPVPTKVMIRPDGLARGYGDAPAPHNPSFEALRSVLEADGVEVFDPTPTLLRADAEQRAFLYTDSHWSPAGVDAVAADVAEQVRRMDLAWTSPEVEWRRRPAPQESVGDLALTLRLPPWSGLYPPEPARPQRVSDADGQPWRSGSDAEVVLLGDSFTNVYSDSNLHWGYFAGLAEQLSFHLRRGVHRVAVNNAGATGSRELLDRQLRGGTFRLDDVKVVIWQFAVRELVTGDWQPVALRYHPPQNKEARP